MSWYYMRGQERVGPVDEVQFRALLASSEVASDTFVWRQGMSNWQRWSELQGGAFPGAEREDAGLTAACAECGQSFDKSEMISYKGAYVCALCKPVFFQRVKEGAELPHLVAYGAFGRRFVAKVVDGLIMGAASTAVAFVTGGQTFTPTSLSQYFIGNGITIALGAVYNVFFLGRYGATPGKMMLGLKVVRPDGSPITYLRALGRFFAEYVSAIILYFGYLMVLFDEQRRALHDRICDTRVVVK